MPVFVVELDAFALSDGIPSEANKTASMRPAWANGHAAACAIVSESSSKFRTALQPGEADAPQAAAMVSRRKRHRGTYRE